MKGSKDEEKVMGPLFPRLRINDAEKGGPRAPPRNKMALYEQLSVPSQKFTSGSTSIITPLPNNSGSLVPSTSSSHGGGQNRSLCAPFCNSPAASRLAERLHPYSSSGMNLKNLDLRPRKPTKYHPLNAAGNLSMAANCSLSQPHSISNSKSSSVNRLGDEDDLRVPTFVHSKITLNCGDGQQNMDKEKITTSSPNRELQTAYVKQLKQTCTADIVSMQHMRNQTEENSKMSPSCQDHAKKHALTLANGDMLLVDASSNPLPRGRISNVVKRTLVSLNPKKIGNLVDVSGRLYDYNVQLHHQFRASQENKALRNGVSAEPKKAIRKSSASTLEGVSCSRPLLGDKHRSPIRLENVSECHEDQCGSLQVREVDRNIDISDTSILDSISGVDISPDDVVGVIGQKQFWKARRAIVNQQRAFAMQVFELHRLIKVQRLFAASPDLLLENKLYLGKSSIKILPGKLFENVPEATTLLAKSKDDPQRPNHTTECTAENALRKHSVPSLNGDTDKGLKTQQSNYKPYSAKPAPWHFLPPPGNQWLVPVMSPSEGLIYKPYTGPCPPTAGFMAPVYGSSCGPMNLTPVGGDFLNAAYRIPASQQQGIRILSSTSPLGQTYFSPYGMPLMNPSISSSAVEQASKQSEVQASTAASSPSERVGGDALPLFPTTPTIQVSDQPSQIHSMEQRTRVIKVVPHNPRSASESAARIFESIQEERRQSD